MKFLLAALAVSWALLAQPVAPLEGQWEGTLQIGSTARPLAVKIARSPQANGAAHLTIPKTVSPAWRSL